MTNSPGDESAEKDYGDPEDYGDPVVGMMLGVCVGYYLGKGVTPKEIAALAQEQAELIVRRLRSMPG